MRKHIPNSITCCNLVSGCIAISFAFAGKMEVALLFIIIGTVFDFFDGMVARLLNVSSSTGKELDSLANVITFSAASLTIIFSQLYVVSYPVFLEPLHDYLPYTAFIMAAFSALRLAKFNLDERQALGFIGLLTPANALFWDSLLVGVGKKLETYPWALYFILVGILISSWLFVSEIPMFALKFKHWSFKGDEVKYLFLITCCPLIAISGISSFAIITTWYMILSAIVKQSPTRQ